MALPNDPILLAEAMDPSEVLDFVFDFAALLEPGEVIDDFALTMSAEGAALGLSVLEAPDRGATLIEGDRAVRLWVGVEPGAQNDAAFAGDGLQVGIELRATTNSEPPRTRERTFALTVRQR
ncbi:hypothetical protein ACFOMD_01760 [Sphingoaurantiacus capsulatus]|uniref:Uncharacterized protein n=1 Tax=Sphingoaurantiacus capsulatus TaxID=1771310 RepID=A0ABV7X7P3_9SPHN